MIKKTDLRIGNLVCQGFSVLIYTVKSINQKDTTVIDYPDTVSIIDYDSFEFKSLVQSLKPILLTPEWLEKFGFIQNNNAWSKNGLSLFDYNFSQGELYLILNASSCPLPNVKYVHQLQNLYFALTGEELEFNQH